MPKPVFATLALAGLGLAGCATYAHHQAETACAEAQRAGERVSLTKSRLQSETDSTLMWHDSLELPVEEKRYTEMQRDCDKWSAKDPTFKRGAAVGGAGGHGEATAAADSAVGERRAP